MLPVVILFIPHILHNSNITTKDFKLVLVVTSANLNAKQLRINLKQLKTPVSTANYKPAGTSLHMRPHTHQIDGRQRDKR